MTSMTAILALVPTALLFALHFAQGTACLTRAQVPLSIQRFGLLNLCLWALGLVLWVLLFSGALVFSAALGIVMVQGLLAGVAMALLLVGSAVGAALLLHVSRLQARRASRLPWLLGVGFLVGALAVARLQTLNPYELTPLRIYAYHFWWPPLLVWASLCLLDTVLTMINVSHRACRLWLATAVASGLALLALSQPLIGNPGLKVFWQSCLLALVPISMSVVTWRFLRVCFPPSSAARRWLRRSLTWLPAGVGLLNSMCSGLGWHLEALAPMASWESLLWLCWPGIVGLIKPPELLRVCHTLKTNGPTAQQIGFLIASAALALGLAVAAYVVRVDRTFLPAGFIVAWLLLAEAIAGGPLSHWLPRLIDRQQWSAVGAAVSRLGMSVGACLASLLSVPSMPVFLGKTLLGIVILVALNEFPNAGKTLIQPFKTPALPERTDFGKPGPERDDLGQAIADRVVNSLGLLQQELRQEVVLSSRPEAEDEVGRKKFELMSVSDSTQVSAALGKSADLEISGVKIPLGMLFTPLQGPIRRLLGVRVINASVQADQDGYSLLASSDAGETWRIPLSLEELASPSRPISPEAVARLAAEFAFHIIASDATVAPAITKSWSAFRPFKRGLQAWKAFEMKQDYHALSSAIEYFRRAIQEDPGFAFAHYRLGLALQKDGQPGAAVRALQAGLQADPSLIPAYIALASTLYDFERTSYLGEVGSPRDFLPNLPPERERMQSARALWLEVLRLPMRGDSVANLGSAYYGLCRQALRQGRQKANVEARLNPGSRSIDNAATAAPQEIDAGAQGKGPNRRDHSGSQDYETTHEQWHYMAHYYCKRAEGLYARLSTARQVNPEIKKGQAYVFHTLGVILANFQPAKRHSKGPQPGWECWVTKPRGELASREALHYFIRASNLLPDDYRIRCYAARTAFALGDPSLLERLEADVTAHLSLANGHRRLARVCAWIERLSPAERVRLEQTSYQRFVQVCDAKDGASKSAQHYQLAVDEYNTVLRREPVNIEALTGYGDTVWERLIHGRDSNELRGWMGYYAERALGHALKGVALSSATPDRIIHAQVRARLGKAFLAQGSPEWAIKELEEAIPHIPNHPAFHEIPWALAQAYLCAVVIAKHAGFGDEDVRPREKRAIELLGDIRQREGRREFQLYSRRPGLLDSPSGSLVCDPRFGMESLPDPPMTFQTAWK